MKPENERHWSDLTVDEQLVLREAYGHYLDRFPPTCDPVIKLERFCLWLNERGIQYSDEP